MKGKILAAVIVVCALLLPGPIPVREPVQARLAQQTVPEALQALPFHVGSDGVKSDVTLSDQSPFAAVARVETTAAADCDGTEYYVTIHSGDIDGDGVDELLSRRADGMEAWRFNPTSGIWVRVASGGPFSDWDEAKYYATIHSADINGDGVDEVLGRGIDGIVAWAWDPSGEFWWELAGDGPFSDSVPGWDLEKHYATIHSGDIDGDGVDELLGRGVDGMEAWRFNGTFWDPIAGLGPFSDAAGWDEAKYYVTIHSADNNGDGVDELLGRWADGMQAWRFNGTDWGVSPIASGGPFDDAYGWDFEQHYATIHSGDIDGDGVDELLGRGVDGMEAWRFNGTGWDPPAANGPFSDSEWDEEKHYATIHSADINSDGVDEVLGRGVYGMVAWAWDSSGEFWWELAADGPYALWAQESGHYNGYWYGSSWGYMYPDWMAGIPDDRRLSELSIPGTHDSGARWPYFLAAALLWPQAY